MKKVLIIADIWHASPRIPCLVKYFSELGWRAVVVTGTLPEILDGKFEIVQTPFPDIVASLKKRLHLKPNKGFQEQMGVSLIAREGKNSVTNRLTTFVRGIVAYPDEYRNWKPFAIKAAEEILQREKIDAMISSSSPVTAHVIAKAVKDKYEIPWIADLRDLWTQNHNYRYGLLRRLFEERLELKTLLSADAVVTVSPVWAEDLKALHKKEMVYAITNGFDPDDISNKQINSMPKFTITYTGQIYTGKQDPSKFLVALSDLISEEAIGRKDIEIRFYGPENELLEKEIQKYGLSAIVKQCGVIPRKNSHEKQKGTHVLLLLNWNDKQGKGWYPLKIFEYLAAQRPILAVGGLGDDAVRKVLDETRTGVYCKNVEDIKSALRRFYLEYKQKGKVDYEGDAKQINRYSYQELAKSFVGILDSLS